MVHESRRTVEDLERDTVVDCDPMPLHTPPGVPSEKASYDGEKHQHAVNDDSVLPQFHEKNGQTFTTRELEALSIRPEELTGWRAKWASVKRPLIHAILVVVLLGWWISGLVLDATRHRWIVSTLFVWFFLGLIFFQYVPTSIFSKPIGHTWEAAVSRPWFKLPYYPRLAIGWLCLLALIFGSAFGTDRADGTSYGDKAQSIFGLFVFYGVIFLTSKSHRMINWRTIIVGLGFQQIIALLVLKTQAFFDVFNWIATLAADFLSQAYPASLSSLAKTSSLLASYSSLRLYQP